jgi:hypothetical protein
MQDSDIIIVFIKDNPCCVSNTNQHHFEDRGDYFWCRLCGYYVEKEDANFQYLKTLFKKIIL